MLKNTFKYCVSFIALSLGGLAAPASAQFVCAGPDVTNLNPATWSETTYQSVEAVAAQELANVNAAMAAESLPQIEGAIADYVAALLAAGGSAYISYPEVAPTVAGSINTGSPNLSTATNRWNTFATNYQSVFPWQMASLQNDEATDNAKRLRNVSRFAKAFALSMESNLDPAYGVEAEKGMNYIVSTQGDGLKLDGSYDAGAVGVFGLPYSPGAKEGSLMRQLALSVDQYLATSGIEVRESKTYSEGGQQATSEWVTTDFTNGGALLLDNGEAGASLLLAAELSGSNTYKFAGLDAATWAIGQPLVSNWNYNAMSALLLARAYRVSGQTQYLTEAKRVMEKGVLPAQYQTGRWVDSHNVRPQYHGIMLSAMVEYYLALKQQGGSDGTYADTDVAERIKCALDSTAAEVLAYGTSNADEVLYLEGLVFGTRIFGAKPTWVSAMNVVINYFTNEVPAEEPVPAPYMSWLLANRDYYGLAPSSGFEWTVLP